MNRRSLLKLGSLFGIAPLASGAEKLMGQAAPGKKPIVLYCDLAVDPAREQEMLDAYHNHFRPVAVTFPGYVDLKIVKIRKTLSGQAPPAGVNYRFQLTYESEEARQKWIHSAVHLKNWPLIENTVIDKHYQTLLTDEV
jgi:antibiotic biosynthesis monooxygenase (ABM) superfamily enzyme